VKFINYMDVLIPVGGVKLIQIGVAESNLRVIEKGAENCHAFIDASAKKKMAVEIVLNAKLQRHSVCNAIESLLIHEDWFEQYGIELLNKLHEQEVKIIAD